ncbi:MAG: stage II sporulation protein R [Eubacteriales bacterium]|nr:stage II sporulation protein R [Clostridiales bacterium]MDY5732518.1 stage II sporulation protein R [Eubacteriales bacterium]
MMSSISKKSLISLTLAIVVLAVSTACFDAESRQSSVSAYCDADSIFRLHIIANSNSAEDQAVKLKVRDAVLEYEAENLDAVSAAKTREELMTHGAELLEIIEGVLRSNGFDYGAQMLVGTFPFPDREYNGVLYPAGDYDAFRVILGDGAGENWWCVMFPPLCILKSDNGKIDTDETIEFESVFVKLFKLLFGGKNAKS